MPLQMPVQNMPVQNMPVQNMPVQNMPQRTMSFQNWDQILEILPKILVIWPENSKKYKKIV